MPRHRKTRKIKKRYEIKQKGRGIVQSSINFLKNLAPSNEKEFLKLLLKPNSTIAELELELQKGVNINALIHGYGFIHYIINDENNNQKLLFLLDNGADINLKDKEGNTPLIQASINVALANLNILIQRGANLEEKNNKGETALWLAAYYGMVDNVWELSRAGANGNVRDAQERTAISEMCKGDPDLDLNDEEYLIESYLEIEHALCSAGAEGENCDNIRRQNAEQRQMAERLRNNLLRQIRNNAAINPIARNKPLEIPETNIGPVHLSRNVVTNEKTGERQPIKNAISWNNIQNGNQMVNFHNELTAKRFYKKNSFNAYKKTRQNSGLNVVNPFTKKTINRVTKYTAKLSGGLHRKKTRKLNR